MKKCTFFDCVIALTLVGLMAVSSPLSASGRVLSKSDQLRSKQVLKMPESGDDGLTTSPPSTAGERMGNTGQTKPGLMKVPVMRVPSQSTVTKLDSMITTADGKVTRRAVYDYDGYGRRILQAVITKNTENNSWDTTTLVIDQYNDAGYQLLHTEYYWDYDLGKTIPNFKYVSVYGNDGNNNLTMVKTLYLWQTENSSWLESSKQDVVFNGQQNQIYLQLTDYSYDTTKGWIPATKHNQANNVEGYSYVSAYYTWSTELQMWVGREKTAYLYDEATDKTLLESRYEWDSYFNSWYRRLDYSFLSDDEVEMETSNYFDTYYQKWYPTQRKVYDYKGDEWFDKLDIVQIWDSTQKVWENYRKTGVEYEDSEQKITRYVQKITRYVEYRWDDASGIWKGVTFYEKNWDDADNLTHEATYTFTDDNKWVNTYYMWAEYDNLTNGEWLITFWAEEFLTTDEVRLGYKQMYRPSSLSAWDEDYTYYQTFAYNEAGTRTQLRTYSWDDTYKLWVNSWKRDYTVNEVGDYAYSIYYDWKVTDWSETSRNTYFYSNKVVGLKAIQARLEVYPNPVADRLVISGATEGDIIIVRDLNGRTLQSLKAFGKETTINTSNLTRGTYLVQVGKQVVKIIK